MKVQFKKQSTLINEFTLGLQNRKAFCNNKMFYLVEAARLFLTLSLMACVEQMDVQAFYSQVEEQSPSSGCLAVQVSVTAVTPRHVVSLLSVVLHQNQMSRFMPHCKQHHVVKSF